MADAILSFALQKLYDILIQKVPFPGEVKEDVESLRKELVFMKAFMKDAEEKGGGDERVREWVSEITDISLAAVDIINDFRIKVEEVEDSEQGIKACIRLCTTFPDKVRIAEEIKSLKKRVLEIKGRREDYGIANIGISSEGTSSGPNYKMGKRAVPLRRTTSYVDEHEYVTGFEDVAQTLLQELTKEEQSRSVISIYGMGGLGKTTLARELYNNDIVMGRFQYRAWVCVSQEYNTRELLQCIIKSFKKCPTKEDLDMLEKMTEEDSERYLREFLKGHQYLVVVDDVWDEEAWKSLKRAFQDNNNGSRVIITTRNETIATRADAKGFIHKLRFLTTEESRDLFFKKAFPCYGEGNRCSPAMESLAKEMVDRCGGLPLALVVLGGLLSRKDSLEEWHKVKDNMWKQLKNENVIEISKLLTLSFNDLSPEMKQCFLYIGMFPEKHGIDVGKLIRLWMAEDFIKPEGQEIKEDLGLNYSSVTVIPRFIGKLKRLQTLEVLSKSDIKLPREICELKQLRHLYGSFCGPLCIETLTNLQTLRLVDVGSLFEMNTVSLENLRDLELHVRPVSFSEESSLNFITNLKNLSTLALIFHDPCSLPLEPLSSSERLFNLYIGGHIGKEFPRWKKFPPSLTKLTLRGTKIKNDPMWTLEGLPNLMSLELLANSYVGEKMVCGAQGFRQLQILRLGDLSNLQEWDVAEGALPEIRGLTIIRCEQLKIPEMLKYVPTAGESYDIYADRFTGC